MIQTSFRSMPDVDAAPIASDCGLRTYTVGRVKSPTSTIASVNQRSKDDRHTEITFGNQLPAQANFNARSLRLDDRSSINLETRVQARHHFGNRVA